MLLSLLLTTLALASDTVSSDKVTQLPEGTVITLPGAKPLTVSTHSFLLPEPMYDRALIKAKQLDICEPALEQSTAATLQWVDLSQKALSSCALQFDVDAKTVEDMRLQVATLDARAYKAEAILRDVRAQRTVAWAITGGLILGAVTVTTVAITQ